MSSTCEFHPSVCLAEDAARAAERSTFLTSLFDDRPWTGALSATLLISVLPLLLVTLAPLESTFARYQNVLVTFAAGAMLGDVCLHILPHALAHGDVTEHVHGHTYGHDTHDHHAHDHHAHDHSREHDAHGHQSEHKGHAHSHGFEDLAGGLAIIAGIMAFLALEKLVRSIRGPDGCASGHTHHTLGGHSGQASPGAKQHKARRSTPERRSSAQTPKANAKVCSNACARGVCPRPPCLARVQGPACLPSGFLASIVPRPLCSPFALGQATPARGRQDFELPAPQSTMLVGGYLNLVADFAHNFTDGLAIGAAFGSGKGSLATTLAVLCHEVPHEVGDVAILMRSGMPRRQALKVQLATAVGAMLGTAVGLVAGHMPVLSKYVSCFIAGGFIYVATVNVIPSLFEKETTLRETVLELTAMSCGVAIMVGVALLE